jgi:hypothetical protein
MCVCVCACNRNGGHSDYDHKMGVRKVPNRSLKLVSHRMTGGYCVNKACMSIIGE